MAKGQRPDFRVFVSRKAADSGKVFYTDIGAGWRVSNDGISIKLHALPTDGELVMFPPKDDDK